MSIENSQAGRHGFDPRRPLQNSYKFRHGRDAPQRPVRTPTIAVRRATRISSPRVVSIRIRLPTVAFGSILRPPDRSPAEPPGTTVVFHQAEKELTSLAVLRYGSGHRKGGLKILSIHIWVGLIDFKNGMTI